MLKRIKIENFRGIKIGEIDGLGKINVFIGRNNSGKSCILEALSFVRCAFNPKLWSEPFIIIVITEKRDRTICLYIKEFLVRL